eukprot:TRINITY_DN1470_c0_g1_i1.p1 TRINITY_DN1470_c0_g1~~TRINITY_DN1470_c0_g1_i1.p1  ORF type:complete len:654 (+),score=115.30 TRINITY_DN1470_c0_g1_i1:158-2119(+)
MARALAAAQTLALLPLSRALAPVLNETLGAADQPGVAPRGAPSTETCKLGIPEICNASPDDLITILQGGVVAITATTMICFVVSNVLHRKSIESVPESLLVVLLGSALGAFFYGSPILGPEHNLDETLVYTCFAAVLKLVALPIIIFESGWSLRRRDFFSQFGYILGFAIAGTLACVFVLAGMIKLLEDYIGIKQWRTAFAYAALISSTDPVATLSTFGHLNVDPLLYILVFGESQINDAVAISLFDALNNDQLGPDGTHSFDVANVAFRMVEILFGSILLGIGLALVYVLIMRIFKMGHSASDAILFIFLTSFFAFSLAEYIEMSGIITVLFMSVVMGAYAPAHLDADTTSLVSFFLKQMASLADTSIFLVCGIMAVFVVTSEGRGSMFGGIMCLCCIAARALSVFPVGIISNAIKWVVSKRLPNERKHYISGKHMFMMWHSGLRGGVSLMLAMDMGDWVDKTEGEGTKAELINGTFLLIVVFLCVFGSTAGACLRCVGLPLGDEVPPGATLYNKKDKHGMMWRALQWGRRNIFNPVLVGSQIDVRKEGSKLNVLQDIINEAHQAEASKDFGKRHTDTVRGHQVTRSHLSSRSLQMDSCSLAREVYDLFGTTDPAHVDALEDIITDLRGQGSDSESEEESSNFNSLSDPLLR